MDTTVVIISKHPQQDSWLFSLLWLVFNKHQLSDQRNWPVTLAEQHFKLMADYDDDSCMIIGVCEEISWQKKPGGRLPGVRLQHETQICRLRIKQTSHKRFVGIENSANPKSKY